MMKYSLLLLASIMVSALSAAVDSSTRKPFQKLTVPEKEIVSLKAELFTIPESHHITMIQIPKGSFIMGSEEDEMGRHTDEKQREVKITKPFYMCETEISQKQFLSLMRPDFKPVFARIGPWGHSLSEIHQGGPWLAQGKYHNNTDNYPMENVSWIQAMKFCKKLNDLESKAKRLPKGYHYRLPTEAEWEYACRAGTTGPFNSKDNLKKAKKKNSNPQPSRTVYERQGKNAFGLYQMHFGVFEWVLDNYDPYPFGTTDPVVFAKGKNKVARGGDDQHAINPINIRKLLKDEADRLRYVRSASRAHFPPGIPYPIVGFRPVLAPVIKVPILKIPADQLIELQKM